MTKKKAFPTPWEALPKLPKGEQAILITVLAEGYARLVAMDYKRFWPMAENAVFNDWVLLYCDDVLRLEKLTQLISYCTQLEDIAEFVPGKLQVAALENAERAVALRQWLIKKEAASTKKRRRR